MIDGFRRGTAVALLIVAAMLGGCIPNQEYQEPPSDYPPPPPQQILPDQPRDAPVRYRDHNRDRPQLPPPDLSTLQQPWEMRPVTADAQQVDEGDYVVGPGETLRSIAAKTGAGSEAIARVNGITPPFVIFPGQRLHIPGGRYHLVRQGETGIAIARAYGVPWSRIVEANELVEPYVLRSGQRILIPSTVQTPADRDRALQLVIDDIVTGGSPALATNGRPAKASPAPLELPDPGQSYAPPPRLTSGFIWPVNGQVVKRFGPGASGERNDGIKIAVAMDTPVKASADGTVAYVGQGVAGLGGLVILKHGNGWTTVYGHADKVLVQRGQAISKGQTIALSGKTGFADRPELHFEMRKGRTPVDPLSNLPAR